MPTGDWGDLQQAKAHQVTFDFACPDWAECLEQGSPPMLDLPLDLVEDSHAVGIIDNLRFSG